MKLACTRIWSWRAMPISLMVPMRARRSLTGWVVAFPTSLVIPLIVKDARACPATVKVTRQRIEAGKTHVWFSIVERAFDGDSDKMESYFRAWRHFAQDNRLN